MFSACEGQYRHLEHFLNASANVDFISDDGWDSLSKAVYGGHLECSRVLVDHGADVNSTNNGNNLPQLELALLKRNLAIFNLLLAHKADSKHVSQFRWDRGLLTVIRQGDPDCVKTLLPWYYKIL